MTRRALFTTLCAAPVAAALPSPTSNKDSHDSKRFQKMMAHRRMIYDITNIVHHKPLSWQRKHGLDYIVSSLKAKLWAGEFESLNFTYLPTDPKWIRCDIEIDDIYIVQLFHQV